jgi:DNA-binding NtrC family response regulator
MRTYHWPRNIRELENALRSALLLTNGTELALHHLPDVLAAGSEPTRTPATAPNQVDDPLNDLAHSDPDALKRRLVELYRRHHGNTAAVARELGKVRNQILRWNERLGIDPSEFKGSSRGGLGGK